MINESDYKPEVLEQLRQPWTIEIRPYNDGGYFARVVELRGCMTEADTQLEALQLLEEAQAEWLAAALEHGDPIPKPSGDSEYSGKIFVRTSPHLHRMVSEAASREGVSMSQWIGEVLSRAVSFQEARLWWTQSDDIFGAIKRLGEVFEKVNLVTDERIEHIFQDVAEDVDLSSFIDQSDTTDQKGGDYMAGKASSGKRTVSRSAKSGQFVKKSYADRHKSTTVNETVSRKSGRKKK